MHFDLYKYVFTHERQAIVKNETKSVLAPPKENFADHLSTAKPYHIWEYEQKINPIENKERQIETIYRDQRIRLNQEDEILKNKLFNELNIQDESAIDEEVYVVKVLNFISS